MRIVAALGGNALLKRGETLSAAAQRETVAQAAVQLASLVAAGHSLIVTHGNGPQVGLLALQAEAGPPASAQPLDDLDAESEGWIGYALEQELANALPPGTEIATLLTRIEVKSDDPAFAAPSKPIGPVYNEETAKWLAAQRGWQVAPDGQFWRRVVASPAPVAVLNETSIIRLMEAGTLVICAGGGGIPVLRDAAGKWRGAEAVIDKDAASALLAARLHVDLFMMLTDVEAVYLDYGTSAQRPLRQARPEDLAGGQFAAGSMGPKVAAACRFASETGRPAAIGRLQDAGAILAGTAGTRIC
ncbi:carbamate kinase [Acidocella sp.]|uniref:carbamate kinase n=1 Tax=Acidocella sp. TaxID=50710 RepID=UPI003CFE0D5E